MVINARCLLTIASLTVVALSGCSWFPRSLNQGNDKIVGSAVGGDPSVTPFRLDVLQESNDGKNLTIQGQLISKSQRPSKDVLVRLTAVDAKGEERTAMHKVADLIPNGGELSPSMPTQFSLSLPAAGISNYQIEVLWGKDAAPYLGGDGRASLKQQKEPSEFLALRNLEVHRVPDGSCSSPEECLVTFSIKGEFYNAGRATIRDVVVVAGFAPASKMGLPNHPLENEKRIEVQNLELAPQATKPFRLSLEKLLPASDTVAYQPVVRIVSFESDW
jgi:hypothetical protein